MIKKLAVVIVLVFAAGGYFLYQHEAKEEPTVQAPRGITNSSTNSSSNTAAAPTTGQASGKIYKDGTYTGDTTDAFYGLMQVQVLINGGKIIDVKFLQFPDKPGHTIEVSNQALPLLKQEAIQKQATPVDVISGATQDTDAFNQSLASALTKAQ